SFRSFFFQAEDGIRDGHVTGVQTCALPIYVDQLRPQGAAGQWTDSRQEVVAYRIPSAVVAGDRAAPREVPDRVGREALPDRLEISGGERRVEATYRLDVALSDGHGAFTRPVWPMMWDTGQL